MPQHIDPVTASDHPASISKEALSGGAWAAQIVGLHDKARKRSDVQLMDPVAHAAAYYEAMAVQAKAVAAHGAYLRSELLEGLREDANRLVSTPGYGPRQPRTEVWAVLQDLFASEQGDSILRDMTTLLGQRVKAGDPLALRIAGMVCDEHSSYHAGDEA